MKTELLLHNHAIRYISAIGKQKYTIIYLSTTSSRTFNHSFCQGVPKPCNSLISVQ